MPVSVSGTICFAIMGAFLGVFCCRFPVLGVSTTPKCTQKTRIASATKATKAPQETLNPRFCGGYGLAWIVWNLKKGGNCGDAGNPTPSPEADRWVRWTEMHHYMHHKHSGLELGNKKPRISPRLFVMAPAEREEPSADGRYYFFNLSRFTPCWPSQLRMPARPSIPRSTCIVRLVSIMGNTSAYPKPICATNRMNGSNIDA
jgi:hypothetical protein